MQTTPRDGPEPSGADDRSAASVATGGGAAAPEQRPDREELDRSFGQRLLDVRRWGALTGQQRRESIVPIAFAVVLLIVIFALGLLEPLTAIVIGVGVAVVYFVGANKLLDLTPDRFSERVRPWVFVAPALLFLFAFLVIPALRTIYISFLDRAQDRFVGFENYEWAFTDRRNRIVFRNNVLWILGVTTFSTGFGLLMAVLADRIKRESFAKALVFLPMAISFVGASVIWRFVYSFRGPGQEQIGLLNAVWTGLGNEPVAWLLETPWNTFFLIVVMIWMQTGFAMVVLSAAIKGVPIELIEAARIDGANEWQVFRRITLPSIAGTLAVVVTTTIILVLKVFDIVRVMTSGNFETSVIANEMISQSFSFGNQHRGAALAVVLFMAVVPVMFWNVRRFRRDAMERSG